MNIDIWILKMYIIIGIKYNFEFCIFEFMLCLRFRGIEFKIVFNISNNIYFWYLYIYIYVLVYVMYNRIKKGVILYFGK